MREVPLTIGITIPIASYDKIFTLWKTRITKKFQYLPGLTPK
jgi:hypothetical protein